MANRRFWQKRIKEGLEKRSVVWLSGVRRVGKTMLCKSIPNIEYFDCELPRVRRAMEDPESFLDDLKGRTVALDEIHRLGNPSELLKIAADHYPETKIIATGSSTLSATAKFKDTLAGRKTEIWLTPMMSEDIPDFGITGMDRRFIRGGLPPFFLSDEYPERDFQEWMDAYWAKDIQELFKVERRYSFLKFAELLLSQSGGIFEATRFAGPCEVSRTTISNYLAILEATYLVHIIRPFSAQSASEIISAPKVYAFDTGFICHYKGWNGLRREDYGMLWEHYVLNELHAQIQSRKVFYWRDKSGHELDFVFVGRQNQPMVIECKWSAGEIEMGSLKAFRRRYPDGANYIVANDVKESYSKKIGDIKVTFVNLMELIKKITR